MTVEVLVTVVIVGIQELLNDPNPNSPAQGDANNLFTTNKTEYEKRIRKQAQENLPEV